MNSGKKVGQHFKVLVCSLLAATTVLAFNGVFHCDFLFYDDAPYITHNEHVREGLTLSGVRWAFTSVYESNWYPLTWISHMLDVELFGLSPAGHHLTALALHVLNGLILFLLLCWLTRARWRSAVVAGLFALHPLHVESVAWIAERKDVLSTLLWLLTTVVYARYTRGGKRSDYLLAVGLFTLGLMSKPMLVTLPFALLLLDFWPLGRTKFTEAANPDFGSRGPLKTPVPWHRLLVEKIPFFLLAASSSAITLFAQKSGGAIKGLELYPLGVRIANALIAPVAYLGKTAWPSDLAIFYVHPQAWAAWKIIGAAALLVFFSVASVALARQRPYLLVGWLWFLGTLIPVIGIVQVGLQSMADRYTYIPLIGIFIAVAWGGFDLARAWALPRAALAALVTVTLVACGICTQNQVQHWKNTETLFTQAIATSPENFPAHLVLGEFLLDEGRIDEGIFHCEEVARIAPDYGPGRFRIGRALVARKRFGEALPHLEAARKLQPRNAQTRFLLASVMERREDRARAIAFLREGLSLRPGDVAARTSLGFNLHKNHQGHQAIAELRTVLRIEPNAAMARRYLAFLLSTEEDPSLRNIPEAIRLMEQAVENTSYTSPVELQGLARVYAAAGRFKAAARVADRLAALARLKGNDELARQAEEQGRLYRSRKNQ